MDGENNQAEQPPMQEQQLDQQPDENQMLQQQQDITGADNLAQEEAFLEAQAQSLAEVKRRRKE